MTQEYNNKLFTSYNAFQTAVKTPLLCK